MLKAYAGRLHRLLWTTDILFCLTIYIGLLPSALVASEGASGQPSSFAAFDLRLVSLAIVASLSLPLTLKQYGLYRSQRRQALPQLLSHLAVAGAVATAVIAAGALLFRAPVVLGFPVVCGASQLLAVAATRVVVFSGLRIVRRRGQNYRNVLIVGSGPRASDFRRVIGEHREWGLRVVGFVDKVAGPVDPTLRGETIHRLCDMSDVLKTEVVNEVILACPLSLLPSLGDAVAVCAEAGVPITLLSDVFGENLPPPRVTHFDALAALSFAPVHHSESQLFVKRCVDVAGAAALALVSAPLVAAAALAIRLDSSGPIFFRQERCGLHGRRFQMLKLRTMCADAEKRQAELLGLNEMDGPVFKIRDDPRVTRVGRILRKWSLDEFPQLWSVIKGDMSLVGPRPPIPGEVDQYANSERRRLSMRPGITGPWQVSGRNTVGFSDWVKLDLEYIDSWSLAVDLRILLKTPGAVLLRTGAS